MRFVARRYDTHELVEVSLDGPRVARVLPISSASNATAPWVAPGFVDVQVNGYDGQEFSDLALTPERVAKVVRRHYEFGVTGICPTLTTQSFDVLAHGMQAIAAAAEASADVGRAMIGIHLEGPFFSTEDGARGAHPKEHCRRPDWDMFQRLQEAAGGRIRILTMSVEFDEAPDFIARVAATGVIVSIGHTGATGPQIRAAVDAGASMSTHLGNGAHRMLRRHPNYLWDQLAEDRLTASLIVDGHHLPPEVVKTMIRAKTPARIVLVSDVSGLAGLPPGRYAGSGCEIDILADGRLVIAGQDQLLAGAGAPIGDGIINAMRFAGLDLETAVALASTQPARLLDRPHGGLRPGDPADLVLFELSGPPSPQPPEALNVRATLLGGEVVYGRMP